MPYCSWDKQTRNRLTKIQSDQMFIRLIMRFWVSNKCWTKQYSANMPFATFSGCFLKNLHHLGIECQAIKYLSRLQSTCQQWWWLRCIDGTHFRARCHPRNSLEPTGELLSIWTATNVGCIRVVSRRRWLLHQVGRHGHYMYLRGTSCFL